MLIQYKIVIVIDGLDLDWTKTIQDICDKNLPFMENNELLKAHKPSIQENNLSRTTRTCLVDWFNKAFILTSKCKCSFVVEPVLPCRPIVTPLCIICPGFTLITHLTQK